MHHIGIIFIWACFWSSSFPQLRYTIHRFPLHHQGLLPFTSSELLRHHPLFRYLLKKKNFRQTSKIHLSGLTFFEMPCDGYPWAPAILQKPIWSYWSIRKDSLIDFHVMLKGAELLFFRLKILFNWKIIVVEVTETFLSPGNKRRKVPSLNLLRDLCSGASSGWKTDILTSVMWTPL